MRKALLLAGGCWLLFCLALVSEGCVTTRLTPEGQKVRATWNPTVVTQCKFIARLKGRDEGTWDRELAEDNAITDLQNRAGALGADTVFVERIRHNALVGGPYVEGEAYRCNP